MAAFPPHRPAGPAAADAALRVLIVDDERAVREGLRRLISASVRQTHEVRLAASPAEALREAETHKPHVVVLDLDLAGEDGLALLRHFVPAARVLVLTSHGDPAVRARALALGASAFVEKHAPAAALLAQFNALAARH